MNLTHMYLKVIMGYLTVSYYGMTIAKNSIKGDDHD